MRNGGNPLLNDDQERAAHWFDGDGMLSGVLFRRVRRSRRGRRNGRDERAANGELIESVTENRASVAEEKIEAIVKEGDAAEGSEPDEETIIPTFTNQYVQTDVYLASQRSPHLRRPFLPSIATLVDPLSSIITILTAIVRTCLLVLLSRLPGARQAVKRISVANTGILWHDGRALASCESGPPMRVLLPGLETVGWFDGRRAENEGQDGNGARGGGKSGYGGEGFLSFMNEWTTGHVSFC